MSSPIENRLNHGVIPPSEADLAQAEGIYQNPNFLQRVRRWALPYLMSVATTLLATACSTPARVGDTSTVTIPEVTATSFAEPSPTATSTPEPTATSTPEPTSTPEARVENAPCTILPDKYCNQAVRIETTDSLGNPFTYIGFENLDPKLPIISPRDGQVGTIPVNAPPRFQGYLMTIRNPYNLFDPLGAIAIYGDFKGSPISHDISAGNQIGETTATGARNFNGKYSLVMIIVLYDQNLQRAVSDVETMRKMFPAAFAKSADKVANQSSNKPIEGPPVFKK